MIDFLALKDQETHSETETSDETDFEGFSPSPLPLPAPHRTPPPILTSPRPSCLYLNKHRLYPHFMGKAKHGYRVLLFVRFAEY